MPASAGLYHEMKRYAQQDAHSTSIAELTSVPLVLEGDVLVKHFLLLRLLLSGLLLCALPGGVHELPHQQLDL